MLDPSSSLAKSISDLFWLTLAIGGVVFALVTGVALYASFRFRESPNNPRGRQVFGNTRLEVAWTVAPLLIVIVLTVLTVLAMGASDPIGGRQVRANDIAAGRGPVAETGDPEVDEGEATPTPDLVLTGNQWWWSAVYPQLGITTANEIYIPVGRDMVVEIRAEDVMHDPWVVKLGRKMDMTPGYKSYLMWRADEPGTYPGFCAEYCGTQHAWMLFRVVAVPQDQFDDWARRQAQPAPTPSGALITRGREVFLSRTCVNCHAISGTEARGSAGPDLSHVGSRWALGAGVIPNTRDNLARWIRNPHEIKPGVLMPGIRITEQVYLPEVQITREDLDALVAYLESLK